ncbi:MAG: ABC transporter permease subunit [Burkholderiales bacterium]
MGAPLHALTASTARTSRALAVAPAVTVAAFGLPIAAGLAGTVAPAFGFLPAIGGHSLTLDPWRELVRWPGFTTAVVTSVATGFAATLGSLLIALAFTAWACARPWGERAAAWLAPILATPHSAFAIGLAFVIAPSGWIVRALTPWLTGFEVPPDVATVGHPSGAALVLALMVKEVPYLVLMIAGATAQVPARESLAIARSLGYGAADAWVATVLPRVWPQIRLPVCAVLAFSLSVVDVALVLGPGNPPTLAVQAVRWFADPDVTLWFPAAAAATLQLAIVVASLAVLLGIERAMTRIGTARIERGRRDGAAAPLAAAGAVALAILVALACASIAGMGLWSLATQWRFPDAWPAGLTMEGWMRRADGLAAPFATTLGVAAISVAVSLALALGCLEFEQRRARRGPPPGLALLYLPLVVPQVAFLFGAQVLLVRTGWDGTLAAVVWAHVIFVLPYLFLSLADPWRSLDPRYARTAASLGAGPWRVFARVKLPILVKPVAIACAVAFAVSVGQYLPTLFAGNGRVATLTTEAVTLSSGADRRVIGAYALLQALLPLTAYGAAALLRERRRPGRRSSRR